MCCVEYATVFLYLETFQSLYDKIQALEQVELKMIETLLKSADTANYGSYELDDGQVRIKTLYRNPQELSAALEAIRKVKQAYMNIFNPSRVILRAGAARNKGGWGRCC